MTYESMEIAAGGAALVGDRWNGAGATIALLHAGVCDRRSWREVGARLGPSRREASQVREILPATLDGETRLAVRLRLFAGWLDARRAATHVRWNWSARP